VLTAPFVLLSLLVRLLPPWHDEIDPDHATA